MVVMLSICNRFLLLLVVRGICLKFCIVCCWFRLCICLEMLFLVVVLAGRFVLLLFNLLVIWVRDKLVLCNVLEVIWMVIFFFGRLMKLILWIFCVSNFCLNWCVSWVSFGSDFDFVMIRLVMGWKFFICWIIGCFVCFGRLWMDFICCLILFSIMLIFIFFFSLSVIDLFLVLFWEVIFFILVRVLSFCFMGIIIECFIFLALVLF